MDQHPADPHRRLRRHRYQEGPDFLFLASQGGRPVEQSPRALFADRIRQRMRAVRLAQEAGVEVAYQQLGCSRRALYYWLQAFEARRIDGLVERSRRPHHLRPGIPAWVDQVVITIRLLTYWNSKRIAAEMQRRQIYRLGDAYIHRLIRLEACARGSVPRRPGERYERTTHNELWHIDVKGPFFIRLAGRGSLKTWMVGLVDDHSRFVIGLRIHTDYQAAPILRWLDECFELCGQRSPGYLA
jgi:Winged helix-turn helix